MGALDRLLTKGAEKVAQKVAEKAAIKGTQEVLPLAEREANKAAMLAKSKEPRRMYHGSQADIKEFLPSHKGSFVSPDPKFASDFAEGSSEWAGSNWRGHGPNVTPVHVMVENPFDYENPSHMATIIEAAKKRFPGNTRVMSEIEYMGAPGLTNNWESIEHPDVQKLIKQLGYDSYYTSERGVKNLGIYDPRRIKSDIGNIGTYDTTNPDINKAKGGTVNISDNLDKMFVETMDRKFSGGGNKGEIKATPRNEFYGKAADMMQWVHDNITSKQFGYQNPVTEMLSPVDFSQAAKVLEEKAYGRPISTMGKANMPMLPGDAGDVAGAMATMGVPVGKAAVKGAKAARAAAPKIEEAVRRPMTPLTMTIEAVSPNLGQRGTQAFREGLTERLLDSGKRGSVDIGTMGGRKTTVRPAQGVFKSQETGRLETNPMRAVDIPGAGDLSKNAALRAEIASKNEALEQEGAAAHRFIPLTTGRLEDATAILIKPKSGKLTPDQVVEFSNALGGDMAVAHNPRLGGVVVYPFGPAGSSTRITEFAQAERAAAKILGDDMKIQPGAADINKDRLYAVRKPDDYGTTTYADLGASSPIPSGKDTAALLDELKYMEKQTFPQVKGALPGSTQEAPTGGVQPWSRSTGYPITPMGVGNAEKTQWAPLNTLTGEKGKSFESFGPEFDEEFQRLLGDWHRGLPSKLD